MLKQQAVIFRRIAISLDLLILVISFLLAYYQRLSASAVGEMNDYAWLLIIAIPSWFILLNQNHLYESLRLRSHPEIVSAIFRVHLWGGIILSAAVFMIDSHHYSRLLLVLFILTSFVLMTICKITIKSLLARIRSSGYNTRNLLVISHGAIAENLCDLIREHDEWGLKIATFEITPPTGCAKESEAVVIEVDIDKIVSVCKTGFIDDVIIAIGNRNVVNVDLIIEELQTLGLNVRVIVDFMSLPGSKKEVTLFHNEIPMVTYVNFSLDANQILAKRCLDIIGGFVGVILTALMLPFIALAIKLDSPGPVFFGQTRARENGRHFKCWKFRSMHANADAMKQKLMEQNELKGAIFKIKHDPRVTRVGRFLRKSSLDEFPQFWNVLIGEMSLVGTRPPTLDEVEKYENWHRKRISIKPGITGLWQISGRNQIQDFDDVVRLDIRYIEEWSIWLDIKIILKTPQVMLMRDGAS